MELAAIVEDIKELHNEKNIEIGESKDAGKKTFDILNYFGFNFEETIEEGYEVPKKTYFELFLIFLWFGCRAFGGPGTVTLNYDYIFTLFILRYCLYLYSCSNSINETRVSNRSEMGFYPTFQ